MKRILLFGALLAACPAWAQDPFEIHVYDYEALRPGQFTLEQHLNYWAEGSRQPEGTVAPTNHQLHMTYELTAGLKNQFSLGFMELNAMRPGAGLEYAGWRVLPHWYAPEAWHLPLKLGMVTEFSFVSPVYEADSRHVEIRPIAEFDAGHFDVVVNPVFARALHGPGTRDGWQLEPAARVAWGESATRRVVPYLEWYSELGPLRHFSPLSEQVHQIFPGIDWRIMEHLIWSSAVGVGLTAQEPRLVVKSHLEFEFGRR